MSSSFVLAFYSVREISLSDPAVSLAAGERGLVEARAQQRLPPSLTYSPSSFPLPTEHGSGVEAW
jgi:hypothetical protein